MLIEYKEARERNLIFKIVKYLKENEENIDFIDKEFDESILINKFYYKKGDIKNNTDNILESQGEKFVLKLDMKEKVKEYFKKYSENKRNIHDIENYKEKFQDIKQIINDSDLDYEKYRDLENKCIDLAKTIHWILLPIYNENMIENRRTFPENIEEYYRQYHALEDLYMECIGKGINWKTTEGDLNLDKELDFKVYSNRWKSYDRYTLRRNIDGWTCEFFQTYKGTKTDGSDSIIPVLEHDSIEYPSNFKYCLDLLWKEADRNEMGIDELQEKINELSIWVSSVEKASKDNLPSWYC